MTNASDPSAGASLPHARYELVTPAELPSPWHVREIDVREELAGEFLAQVELENDDGAADPAALLHLPATLVITRPTDPPLERRFAGVVRHYEEWVGGGVLGRRHCRITIEPAFACTKTELRWAKYQSVTVPEVLRDLLGKIPATLGGESDLRLGRLQEPEGSAAAYAVRDLCVQYDETTWQFARRIMAEEGISYFFDFAGERERMVLVDDNRGFPELPIAVPLRPSSGMVLHDEAVFGFRRRLGAAPDRVVLKTFDATRHKELAAEKRLPAPVGPVAPVAPVAGGEIYDPRPAATLFGYDEGSAQYRKDDLAHQARLRLEREQVEANLGAGRGNVIGFRPGLVFELDPGELALLRFAGRYLLTSVHHHGRAPARTASAGAADAGDYTNEFTCLPAEIPFRPAAIAKPIAVEDYGIVVAPSSDDPIWTDRHGRVRVRFLAERDQDLPPHLCSPFIPVDQRWAGDGFGFQIIPRAGMLVRIAYQHGDPDRPYVVACRNTAVNQLPSPPPEEKTRLTWRTASLRDGGQDLVHGNEISFDDAAGQEEIFIRAGHDYRRKVLHDERTEIDHDEQRLVGRNQTLEVKGARQKRVHGDETILVEKTRATTIAGDDSRHVKGNDTQTVEGDQTVTIHGARTTSVDGHEDAAFHAGRAETVTGDDLLHVTGKHVVTGEQQWQAVQGPTTFTLEQGNAVLAAGGAITLTVKQGRLKLDAEGHAVLEANQKVELLCGQSSIVMTPDKIEIASPELSLTGANGALKLDASGATTTGLNVTSTATAKNELTGAIVKAN